LKTLKAHDIVVSGNLNNMAGAIQIWSLVFLILHPDIFTGLTSNIQEKLITQTQSFDATKNNIPVYGDIPEDQITNCIYKALGKPEKNVDIEINCSHKVDIFLTIPHLIKDELNILIFVRSP
jgi:hypothetical protein